MIPGQLTLLTPAARAGDPAPSHDAARLAATRAPAVRRQVLEAVRFLHGTVGMSGATADEVLSVLAGRGLRLQRNSVSRRLGELVSADLLAIAPHRRESPAGVLVTVYVPMEAS